MKNWWPLAAGVALLYALIGVAGVQNVVADLHRRCPDRVSLLETDALPVVAVTVTWPIWATVRWTGTGKPIACADLERRPT